MDNMLSFVAIIVLVVLVVVAVLAISYYADKRRKEELQAVAGRMGFSFSPDSDPDLLANLGPLRLFSIGHSRRIDNVLRGSAGGVPVTVFDFKYETGAGKSENTRRQTVLLFESDRLRLPSFSLRPEHLFHKMAGALGYQDIDFASHPAFSDAYLVQGQDEAQIRAVFTRQVLDSSAKHGNLCVEGAGSQLICYRLGKRAEPGAIQSFVQEGLDVLNLFAGKAEEIDWDQLLAPLDLPI